MFAVFVFCNCSSAGNYTEAQRILEYMEQAMPGLAVVRVRRAGLERRLGRLDRAESLLTEAMEQSKENPQLHAFYSIKLARLLLKLGKNTAKARSVLQEAIDLNPVSQSPLLFGTLKA